jgi:hypothetical protein
VITRVGIQETWELTSGSEVNDLVNSGKRKRMFRTCLVHSCVINTHPPSPVLLWHKN